MKVDAIIYASDKLFESIKKDDTLKQIIEIIDKLIKLNQEVI